MKISLILVVIGFILILLLLSIMITSCIVSGGVSDEDK